MENSSARSANIRVKRYRADETPEDRGIRLNIQRKNRRLAQRERKRVRHANESYLLSKTFQILYNYNDNENILYINSNFPSE